MFGGKITTYRKLAEHALEKLQPVMRLRPRPLDRRRDPAGRRHAGADFAAFLAAARRDTPGCRPRSPAALGAAYGTRLAAILAGPAGFADLGPDLGGGLYERGRYLVDEEWARTADDVLWRRSRLGLHVGQDTGRAGGVLGRRDAAPARQAAGMSLRLDGIEPRWSATRSESTDPALDLAAAQLYVLLGPTLAGKTSLMRLMAGLDRPTRGPGPRRRPRRHGRVGAQAQRRHGLPAVHQLSVAHRLRQYRFPAAPRRARRGGDRPQVRETARCCSIDHLLDRLPASFPAGSSSASRSPGRWSSGADLLLLDEPLVNLDYKLREELRAGAARPVRAPADHGRLRHHRAARGADHGRRGDRHGRGPGAADRPHVAGLSPAGLAAGRRRLQRPADEHAVRAVEDGPRGRAAAGHAADRHLGALALRSAHTLGVRANHLSLRRRHRRELAVDATVELAEISGSETFIHVRNGDLHWVVQEEGVHEYALHQPVQVHLDPARLYAFDRGGTLEATPAARERPEAEHGQDRLRGRRPPYVPNPHGPQDYALKPLQFAFEDGGAYALLGPSGCGKTTLLNIISGLLQPSEGRVLFDGADVTAPGAGPAQHRPGVPVPGHLRHHDGGENLAFPLRNRGVAPAAVAKRIAEVAAMLDLEPLMKRRASGLSADQKQKISLGRGLVREDVAAILFDEPLTVIDPHLKWLLRRKLKEVHNRFRHTLVYVTHDQNEALTFAEKVVVMYDGEVVQLGTPQELFERPAHRFVGYFIGSPGMNFMPCRLDDGGVRIEGTKPCSDRTGPRLRARLPNAALELGIRPEFVSVAAGRTTRPCRRRSSGSTIWATTSWSARVWGRICSRPSSSEDAEVAGGSAHLAFAPARTLLYADGRLIG